MAKSSRVTTRTITHSVPQTREEAVAGVKSIGELRRSLTRLEADMNDEIAAIKQRYETLAEPLTGLLDSVVEGVRIWAEANRTALTGGDKTKTVDLGTGLIRWRSLPPSVSHRGKKLEIILANIRARAPLAKLFLRTKEELNKEAVLDLYSATQKFPEEFAKLRAELFAVGLDVGSAGEDFVVEPAEMELAGTQP